MNEICGGQKMRSLVQITVNKESYLCPGIFILRPKLTDIVTHKYVYDKLGKKSGHLESLYVIYKQYNVA